MSKPYGRAHYPADEPSYEVGPGWLVWQRDKHTPFDKALHAHIDFSDGRPVDHRHVDGALPHDHEPPTDLSDVSSEDINREYHARQDAAGMARREAALKEAVRKREMQQAKDTEFASGYGLTYEQYDEIEAYVIDKYEEDR